MLETDFKNLHYSIIGKNNSFEGELQIQGDTYVFGRIKGDLIVKDQSLLVIERTAEVEGRIYAYNLEIHGTFSGNIQAEGTLKIHPGGKVSGTIKSNRLVVYPGALLNTSTQVEDHPTNNQKS